MSQRKKRNVIDIDKSLGELMEAGDVESAGVSSAGEPLFRLTAQGRMKGSNLFVETAAEKIRWAAPSHEVVVANGYAGRAFYVYNSEYPDEGALFVAPLEMREEAKVARVIVDEEVKAGCWE